jgi:adenylate cyclase
MIVGAPLAVAYGLRGTGRAALGLPGWREDFDRGATIAESVDLTSHVAGVLLKYSAAVCYGALRPDAAALAVTARALEAADRCGDDFSLESGPAHRSEGLRLLNEYRDASLLHGYTTTAVRWVDVENAKDMARSGDLDGAIETARVAVEFVYESGDMLTRGPTVAALGELLVRRGGAGDLAEARAAIERLAAVPVDPGFVLHELPLHRLRALMAHARGDDATYRDHRDRYRNMANELGFEGHIAIAEAMG